MSLPRNVRRWVRNRDDCNVRIFLGLALLLAIVVGIGLKSNWFNPKQPQPTVPLVEEEGAWVTGYASWYDYNLPDYPNYSQFHSTCATRDWPRGTKLEVKYGEVGVVCRVNDYGPDALVHPDRIVDLSSYAFEQLKELRFGIIKVQVRVYAD